MQIHGPGEFDAPRAFSLGAKVADSLFTTAITSYATAQLKRWTSYAHWDKLHVIHCGVNKSFLQDATPLATDSKQFVSIGRLTAQKGQLLLVDAVAEVVRQGHDIQLVLAGDGEMRQIIEQRIATHGIGQHVRITGWIGEQQVRELLRESRAMVLPSFAEGLPVAIMEAFALERPVISTLITGVPELVQQGANGWLVTAGDRDHLVSALLDCLQTTLSRIREMGAHGAACVRENHNAAKEAEKLAALLQQYVPASTTATATIWGVPFTPLSYEQTLSRIDTMVRSRQSGYFVTANLNYLMLCERQPAMNAVNREANFVIADGMPIVWRSRLGGTPLPERIAGSDLIYSMAELAAQKGHSVFLLGGAAGVAAAAAEALLKRYPALKIAGVECPPFRVLAPHEEVDLVARIRAAKPDILLVALGQPKGELWIHRWYKVLEVPVCVQLGGSFNFVTGQVQRAPQIVAQWGLEWLWRCACEPLRLGPRYVANFCFLIRAVGRELFSWITATSKCRQASAESAAGD